MKRARAELISPGREGSPVYDGAAPRRPKSHRVNSSQLTAPAPPREQASCPALILEHAVTAAADRERRRLARMLHDTICQSVTGVNLLARVLSRRVKERAPDLESDLLELTDLLRVSMTELQDMVRALAGPQAGWSLLWPNWHA